MKLGVLRKKTPDICIKSNNAVFPVIKQFDWRRSAFTQIGFCSCLGVATKGYSFELQTYVNKGFYIITKVALVTRGYVIQKVAFMSTSDYTI